MTNKKTTEMFEKLFSLSIVLCFVLSIGIGTVVILSTYGIISSILFAAVATFLVFYFLRDAMIWKNTTIIAENSKQSKGEKQ